MVFVMGIALGFVIVVSLRKPPNHRNKTIYSDIPKPMKPMPVQIHTRKVQEYEQVGIVYDKSDIQPLYGRPTYRGSSRFHYYIIADSGNILINIPLSVDGRDCSERNGCVELYTDDKVFVPELSKELNVKIYKKHLQYI